MQIKAFKVQMYRSILDSGWVDVDDITVIVGKNESGKTALLKALHKFNPFTPDPYTLDREWPRGHRRSQSPEAVVVTVRFVFESNESKEIEQFTNDGEGPTGVEISRRYDGDYDFKFFPNDNITRDVNEDITNLLNQIAASEDVSSELKETILQVREWATEAFESMGVAGLGENIDDYLHSLELTVQEDTEQDRSNAERVKNILEHLSKLANIEDYRKGLEELIADWIPTFIYMDDHKPFQGSAYLNNIRSRKSSNQLTEEDKTFLMMLEMAGLNFDQEYQRADSENKEQRMLDMNDASSTLTKLLADHWSQRAYQIRLEADGYHIVAFVSDEVQPALVPLDERSKGFQWFFSFDSTFLHETKGTFSNVVILLDEPGLHLHAAAQRDLLLRLKEYAEGNQLIYTTHMPFLIDMERLDNIRVCTESKDCGTTVSADFYVADELAWFPLQAALGLSISQSLFVGPYNLVVEGVTDFWFLSTMATILRSEGRSSLDERIVVTPAGAATKAAYVATMLLGQQLNVVVLLDSDPEGERAAEGLIKKWIIEDKHILLIGQILGRDGESTLEDMFSDEFYLKFVNDAFHKELKNLPITLDEVGECGQIVKRIERAFVARGLPLNSENKAFNKGRVAKRLMTELPKINFEILPEEMVENFSRLFEEINKTMPGLEDKGASGISL